MRIVVACDWFLKYAAAQAAALAGAGAEALLLCRDHPFEFGGNQAERDAVVEQARAAGVSVLEMPGRLWEWSALPMLRTLRADLARFRPDIVHLHEGVDPRVLALLPRVPTVLTIHDPAPHPGQPVSRLAPKRWFLEGSRNLWRARARTIQVHSERLRGEVALRSGQGCAVIPLGQWVRAEPLPPPTGAVVGFFGRLEPYKGLEVLARAMPRVWESRPDIRLHVVGTGPIDFRLVDPRVNFDRNYLPEAEVENFFRSTSLAVLPYTQASQTGAGSLAVGYGVPVIVSGVGGLPDLALDESYVVVAGDPGALAGAIVRHIDDGPRTRSRVLSEVAAPRSWQAVAESSLALYKDLLGR